jgi:hypothetical protein
VKICSITWSIPGGQRLVLAVPREGAGQAPRRHRAGLIVVKNELELREFLIK